MFINILLFVYFYFCYSIFLFISFNYVFKVVDYQILEYMKFLNIFFFIFLVIEKNKIKSQKNIIPSDRNP